MNPKYIEQIRELWKRVNRQGMYYEKPLKHTEFTATIEQLLDSAVREAQAELLEDIDDKDMELVVLKRTEDITLAVPIVKIQDRLATLTESDTIYQLKGKGRVTKKEWDEAHNESI